MPASRRRAQAAQTHCSPGSPGGMAAASAPGSPAAMHQQGPALPAAIAQPFDCRQSGQVEGLLSWSMTFFQ
jgi:hypothetical protein